MIDRARADGGGAPRRARSAPSRGAASPEETRPCSRHANGDAPDSLVLVPLICR